MPYINFQNSFDEHFQQEWMSIIHIENEKVLEDDLVISDRDLKDCLEEKKQFYVIYDSQRSNFKIVEFSGDDLPENQPYCFSYDLKDLLADFQSADSPSDDDALA